MKIKQINEHFAILDEPRKPYAYRSNKLRYKLLKSNRPWACEQCGTTEDLQVHHIEKTTYLKSPSGYTYQNPASNHSALNGKILCRKCHRLAHQK